jgi:hypothetical protein
VFSSGCGAPADGGADEAGEFGDPVVVGPQQDMPGAGGPDCGRRGGAVGGRCTGVRAP